MWRNICRHTYSDTCGSVYQKIRVSGRKYHRFLFCLIKVWLKINGVLVDICQHFHGNLTQTCFCVTHGSCAVTVHRTKVSVTIHQWITCGPVLCHVYQGTIDGTVSMWMIFTHCITDNTRTFTMRFIRSVVQFDHGVENSALYRFQSVSDIRKRSGCDYAHGIINVGFLHGFFQIHVMNLIKYLVVHLYSSLCCGKMFLFLRNCCEKPHADTDDFLSSLRRLFPPPHANSLAKSASSNTLTEAGYAHSDNENRPTVSLSGFSLPVSV